jgi:hypothetical protein
MFLIKPPFLAPPPGRLLTYGQIEKEKGSSKESKEGRRSQSEAGAQGLGQETDIEEGSARWEPLEDFQAGRQKEF